MPEKIPFGVIAPMTTPFAADGELQAASIRSQVEFLVRATTQQQQAKIKPALEAVLKLADELT